MLPPFAPQEPDPPPPPPEPAEADEEDDGLPAPDSRGPMLPELEHNGGSQEGA